MLFYFNACIFFTRSIKTVLNLLKSTLKVKPNIHRDFRKLIRKQTYHGISIFSTACGRFSFASLGNCTTAVSSWFWFIENFTYSFEGGRRRNDIKEQSTTTLDCLIFYNISPLLILRRTGKQNKPNKNKFTMKFL